MIQPNITKSVRNRIKVKSATSRGKESAQIAINNLLWKIVMNNGGTITVPAEEMNRIPGDAALKATFDSATQNLIVVAIKTKSTDGIWKPGDPL